MDILIRFGFSIEEIKNMMDTNIMIDGTTGDEVDKLIDILKNIGCDTLQIKNILITNPFYLNKSEEEITNLMDIMKKYDFENLKVYFDGNPFLLNFDGAELEAIIDKKISEGLSISEVRDYIKYELI